MRVLIVSLAFVATCVAGPQRPDTWGAYAKYLSRQDLLEIAAIPNNHANIPKPVFRVIAVTGRDQAEVYSGRRPQKIGDIFTTFEVRRTGGHWRLVPGSAMDTELVRVHSWTEPSR